MPISGENNYCRCLLLAAAFVLSGSCYGATIYNVTLTTSALISNSAGPFALDFQLTSGDTSTGVVNTASLSDFNFGSGGNAGVGSPFPNSGNASGSLGSGVSLNTNGSFFNEFSQYFTPGNQLTFQLTLTGNIQPSVPDEFSFQLIDATSTEVPTSDPSGGDSVFLINIANSTPAAQIYSTAGDGVTVTPVLSLVGSQAPEPSAALLAGAGFVLLGLVRRQRGRISGNKS
jgi:hypothetical protein